MLPLGKQAFAYQRDVTVSAEAHNLLWEPGILLRGCECHSDAFPFFRSEFPVAPRVVSNYSAMGCDVDEVLTQS